MTSSLSPSRRVFAVVRSDERAHANHGWLDTYYSFSFADYYDPSNINWGALRVFNDDTVARRRQASRRIRIATWRS